MHRIIPISVKMPLMLPRKRSKMRQSGFTLVEIMIVVAIIGLLAVIAMPSFIKARTKTHANVIVNDFRIFDGAFQQYALESGWYPSPDWTQGAYPTGMETNWLPGAWIKASPIGGYYAFHHGGGTPATIILVMSDIPTDFMRLVDQTLDDGDLSTGQVRGDNQSLDFIIGE